MWNIWNIYRSSKWKDQYGSVTNNNKHVDICNAVFLDILFQTRS